MTAPKREDTNAEKEMHLESLKVNVMESCSFGSSLLVVGGFCIGLLNSTSLLSLV